MKLCFLLLSLFVVIIDSEYFSYKLLNNYERASLKQGRPVQPGNRLQLADGDRVSVERLINESRSRSDINKRISVISERLLGARSLRNPLTGSVKSPEQFVTRMDGFDCVTYVETVLALSKSTSADDFINNLRQYRYKDGNVEYTKRYHYISEWNKNKIVRGILEDMTQGEGTLEFKKILDWKKDIEPQIASFRYFPRSRLSNVSTWLQDGDLIYFVTSRKGLDFSHMGMVFHRGKQLVMRHASRSKGSIVEQGLDDFFKSMPMKGFVILRPISNAPF